MSLEQLELASGKEISQEPSLISMLELLSNMKETDPLDNVNQSVQFAIGLKMFSEVMNKNHNHPLFKDFFPAFGLVMKSFKRL
ncbi:MAG: DUF3861 family protein [Candidatus Amoebophilus sp.]